jgi:hypothetical protein
VRGGGWKKGRDGNEWDERHQYMVESRPVSSPDSSKAFRAETSKEKDGNSSCRNAKDVGRFFESLEENERKHSHKSMSKAILLA